LIDDHYDRRAGQPGTIARRVMFRAVWV